MASDDKKLQVPVRDLGGKEVGTFDLPAEWFGAEVKPHVMHHVVTAQLAAARQGTHKTKTRAQVRGGGRKPWRQKGTGRARQGSIRSPQWVGGGVAHGRVPKDWSMRVNKKVRRSALRSALSDRANSGDVAIVRELTWETPKTRSAVTALADLGFTGRKVLIVLADYDDGAVKSLRNLSDTHTIVVDQLNTYDVLKSDVVIFAEGAIELLGTGRRASSATPDSDAKEVEA